MIYVGDEQKDIVGPQSLSMTAILINRDDKVKEFNQNFTVKSLEEIIKIIENV